MGKIAILPDILCNQIAAGEVVERPAAVVKELMENCIDAGGTRIQVALLEAGRKEIRVVDDGAGMEPDDALLALERHATSKLRTSADLQAIRSLGFRGEALPSIAAVSRFQLITREPQALSATQIQVEGGRITDVREVGAPTGTTVLVRDLFFNLPARRKFLRSVTTELAHIHDQFLRCALAHPSIQLRLNHQGRVTHDFPRCDERRQRLVQVFGPRLGEALKPVSFQREGLCIHGLIGPPELQKADTGSLFLYVNDRPVRDRALNQAILSAYDTLLPRGRFPLAVLFIELAAEQVDVNVHPTKREVRFRRPHEVFTGVRAALAGALDEMRDLGWKRPFFPGSDAVTSGPDRAIREGQQQLPAWTPVIDTETGPPTAASAHPDAAAEAFPAAGAAAEGAVEGLGPPTRFADLPVLGQLDNAYILLQAPDGLIFIDQHAAHERVLFEQLAVAGSGGGQRLGQPLVVELLPLEAVQLAGAIPQLREIGLEIESFGGASFLIHTLPGPLDRCPPERLIADLLAGGALKEGALKLELLAALAKTAACHHAIRAGQRLAAPEIQQLLKQLDRARVCSTCPHGRPLWWKLTHAEIERIFKRT